MSGYDFLTPILIYTSLALGVSFGYIVYILWSCACIRYREDSMDDDISDDRYNWLPTNKIQKKTAKSIDHVLNDIENVKASKSNFFSPQPFNYTEEAIDKLAENTLMTKFVSQDISDPNILPLKEYLSSGEEDVDELIDIIRSQEDSVPKKLDDILNIKWDNLDDLTSSLVVAAKDIAAAIQNNNAIPREEKKELATLLKSIPNFADKITKLASDTFSSDPEPLKNNESAHLMSVLDGLTAETSKRRLGFSN